MTPDDELIPEIPRRDRPVPPSWYREEPGPSASAVEERRTLTRSATVWRYLALAAAILLVSNAISFVAMYVDASAGERPGLAFTFFYVVLVQAVGWTFVGWGLRRR